MNHQLFSSNTLGKGCYFSLGDRHMIQGTVLFHVRFVKGYLSYTFLFSNMLRQELIVDTCRNEKAQVHEGQVSFGGCTATQVMPKSSARKSPTGSSENTSEDQATSNFLTQCLRGSGWWVSHPCHQELYALLINMHVFQSSNQAHCGQVTYHFHRA